jgi:hypothetical protein
MTIATDLTIDASGNVRQVSSFVPGTHTRYTTLELHAFLQDLADNPTTSGDDMVSILGSNPSELAGKRNASRPMALTLLPNININAATSQWFKFGSIEQSAGNELFTGLKVIGSLVASSPIYITQSNAKITKYWADSDVNTSFQVLVQAKTGGTLIDSGNVSVFSRKYGQTYSHFDVSLAAGGEQSAALATSIDTNVDTGTITSVVAASYFATAIGGTGGASPKIALSFGDTTQNLGGGQGSLLHKATITLDGTLTLTQVYQALMWACSESSTITFNGTVPGWRYRVLPGQAYAENISAPFGSFAGGKWFVAQGWWLTGVQAGDSKNYQLTSHIGTVETPPNSVTVTVSGVVSGDYVLVARDTGSDINTNEYTVTGSISASSISVTGLKSDTPVSGVIRIDGDRYTYSSWTGTTVSGLSPTLTKNYTARPAFIPLIDGVASGTSISSAAMQYSAGFVCRYRVRNGGGSPIVPFESTLSVTTTGGSGTAVRNADA